MIMDCFLRVYSMLNSFVEYLELYGVNYLVHYKKLPLQGALEISNKMMTSNFCEDVFKVRVIKRPGLFVDSFRNSSSSLKMTDIPENIANKIETVIKYLTKSSKSKNYSAQIESILFAIANLPCTDASKKLQILLVLLRKAAENVTCFDQIHKEPPAYIQTRILLNLVSNFIREWREGSCETRSHLKTCKFCDSIISDETQQYAEKLCCVEAKRLDQLLKEWILLYASHDQSKVKSANLTNAEHKIDFYDSNTLQEKEKLFTRVHNSDNAELQLINTNEEDISTLEDHYKNHIDSQLETSRSNTVEVCNKHQCNVSDGSRAISQSKVGHPGQSAIETGYHDGIVAKALSEEHGNRSLQRVKTEASAGGARSDGGARNTDTVAERIREKRDNNLYRRGLGEVGDKDRQDRRSAQRDMQEEADVSRIAAGKSREGDGDTMGNTMAEETGGASGYPSRSPYQHRRAEERETRLPDNSAKKISRLDRVEEKSSTEIRSKRLESEQDGNSRRDRHENEEKPVTRRDKRKAGGDKDVEEGTTSKNKMSQVESRKMINSVDDTEKERSAVNEERKLPARDGKYKDASTDPSNKIKYQLSKVHFVKIGWTLLPVTKIMRKIVQYEAKPAKPNLWLKKYRHKGTQYYDDRITPFLRFHPDNSIELFYPNGVLSIRIHRPENRKYDMYTVFTPGGKDALGIERESQILAIFDTMGNGVIFDEDGVARLSYNQIGGIFTDNPAGPPLAWTWNINPRESIFETVYAEKSAVRLQMKFFPAITKSTNSSGKELRLKTPISQSSLRNKEKKVVEVQKPVVEERQEEVGSKIELGTILNFNKEVASYMIEANDWKSDMLRCRFQEKLSKKLDSESSLCDLTKEYRKIKKFAKERKVIIAKYKPFSI